MESLSTLLTEEQKSKAQILELSYDFSCRLIRLYKFLNQKNLCKADKDIVRTLGLQMLRSATSINANINEAQHPQSDADFLSKASIALKEARETKIGYIFYMITDIYQKNTLNQYFMIVYVSIKFLSRLQRKLEKD